MVSSFYFEKIKTIRIFISTIALNYVILITYER